MRTLFDRLSRMDPRAVLAAILIGSAVFVVSRHFGNVEELSGWIAAVAFFFVRPDRGQKAGADATEHVEGTGALGPWGGRTERKGTPDSPVLNLKREILATWAKSLESIDDTTELRAELLALEVIERSARSFPVPEGEETKDEGD